MAQFWLSGDSDFALAMREPNLLIPRRKFIGDVVFNESNNLTKYLTAGFHCTRLFDGIPAAVTFNTEVYPLSKEGSGIPSFVVGGSGGMELTSNTSDIGSIYPGGSYSFAHSGGNSHIIVAFGCTLNSFGSDIGVYGKTFRIWWDTSSGALRLNAFGGWHSYNTNSISHNTPGEFVSAVVAVDINTLEVSIIDNGNVVVNSLDVGTGTLSAADASWFGCVTDGGKVGIPSSKAVTWSHYYEFNTPFKPSIDLLQQISRDPFGTLLRSANQSPYLISVPAGGGVPTLSFPGVTGVQATQATPQVTLTF